MNALDLVRVARNLSREESLSPWRALMFTLLRHLRRITLPPELATPLAIAERYWATPGGDPADLRHAKELTWTYLDSLAGNDLDHSDGRLGRAVLCVLDPEGDDEAISDAAEWFAAMLGLESA